MVDQTFDIFNKYFFTIVTPPILNDHSIFVHFFCFIKYIKDKTSSFEKS